MEATCQSGEGTFKNKTILDVSKWLKDEGFNESVCSTFKENEVDGEGFLLLTDEDIGQMVKAVAIKRKLINQRQHLLSIHAEKPANFIEIEDDYDAETYALRFSDHDHQYADSSSSDNDVDEFEFELSQRPTYSPQRSSPHYSSHYSRSAEQPCSSSSQSHGNSGDEEPEEESNSSNMSKPKKESAVKAAFVHKKIIIRKSSSEEPLPIPFELPKNFSKDIQKDLKENRLIGRTRAKFIASICSAIFRHKAYPNKAEYDHVGEQIIKKFPFLRSKTGSGYGYLVDAMKDKMKYIRNVKPRQKRPTIDAAIVPPSKRPKESKCSKKYSLFPPIPPGEDEASSSRHIKRLQLECQKTSPDRHTVATLMSRTYTFRRKTIMEDQSALSQILKVYPPLKKTEEIFKEFDRIFEDERSRSIREKWAELIPKVFEVAENDQSSALQELYADLTQCTSKESKSILASMMLIHLLADTRTTATTSRIVIFVDEHCDISAVAKDVDQAQPVIIIRGTHIMPQEGYLVTEKVVMSKVPSLADVPLILFATYFVFNMEYCNGCSNFYSFLEVTFLDAPVPKKTKIRHFINMLDNIED